MSEGEDPRATKRDRILAAALDLAGSEGLEALTTRRVAGAAGVNVGLLHYYFDSKESLVAETLGRFLSEMRANLAILDAAEGAGDPEALLVELFSAAYALAARRPALLFGLIARLVEAFGKTVGRKGGSAGDFGNGAPEPIGALAELQGLLFGRVRPLLAQRLGDDEELLARRCMQLFTSIFHPLLFTPFPRIVFGFDIGTGEGRKAYIEGVVSDAFTPPRLP